FAELVVGRGLQVLREIAAFLADLVQRGDHRAYRLDDQVAQIEYLADQPGQPEQAEHEHRRQSAIEGGIDARRELRRCLTFGKRLGDGRFLVEVEIQVAQDDGVEAKQARQLPLQRVPEGSLAPVVEFGKGPHRLLSSFLVLVRLAHGSGRACTCLAAIAVNAVGVSSARGRMMATGLPFADVSDQYRPLAWEDERSVLLPGVA